MSVDRMLSLKHVDIGSDLFNTGYRQAAKLAEALREARQSRAPRILFMGGHPIKLGLSRYLVDLIRRGWITHVATTGAGLIHDYQLTVHGVTDEDVPATLAQGKFGFWDKLDHLNKIVNYSCHGTMAGLGHRYGTYVSQNKYVDNGPILGNNRRWRDVRPWSVLGNASVNGNGATVHVSIGTDILGMYPNYRGGSWGTASHMDFLEFAELICNMGNGVFINMGSAVQGPEVFLKAISMAIHTERLPTNITTAVMDMYPLPDDWESQNYTRDDPHYYWRPWKTILKRALVSKDSSSLYVRGDFRDTVPALWSCLVD